MGKEGMNLKNGEESENDLTLLLSDRILLRIFTRLPQNPFPLSLVCRRWLRLQGLLRHSIKLHDWSFLENGGMTSRFPNLTHVDLVPASIPSQQNACIFLTHESITVALGSDSKENFLPYDQQLAPSLLGQGLKLLAQECLGL